MFSRQFYEQTFESYYKKWPRPRPWWQTWPRDRDGEFAGVGSSNGGNELRCVCTRTLVVTGEDRLILVEALVLLFWACSFWTSGGCCCAEAGWEAGW